MSVLGIDIGSSSVKAGILNGTRVRGGVARRAFATRFDGPAVEVSPEVLLKSVSQAVQSLGKRAKSVDAIALSVMSPAFVAMDARGKALTPIVTHQDRRSVEIAREIEARVGKTRHLKLAGNRPFPGSIASTTLQWFRTHEPARLKKLDLIGLLSTFLIRQFTGQRVIDPSNASFMGLYDVPRQTGWVEELCQALHVSKHWLPEVRDADQIAGRVTRQAARRFGLTEGTPVLSGIIDTSAAMLLAKPQAGKLLNVSGSTDVLMLCMDRARPHELLLTRALGVGKRWMSVATIAAAGSSLQWAHNQLFPELSDEQFWNRVRRLAGRELPAELIFEPYLAGERASIEQRRGVFRGLTLSTSRDDLLAAVVKALTRASADRLPLLQSLGQVLDHHVTVSGGTQRGLGDILHRDWPGKWTFHREDNATLRGLGALEPRE